MIGTVGLEDVKEILDSIARKIRKKVLEAYVFGSIVEGFAVRWESDLDLLIVPRTREDFFELLKDEISSLLDMGTVPHLHIATNPSYERLIKEARTRGIRIV